MKLRNVIQRLLHKIAQDAPGGSSLRPWLHKQRGVKIGSNVWIGGGAILLPGIVVGDDAIIGSGAVVTRDVAPGATVMGNPARAKQLPR